MTAPAFIYTSEPWAALSFGRPIFDPNECRSFAPGSRFTAGASKFFILSQSDEQPDARRNPCASTQCFRGPSLQFPCGIFVTLGKCFRPITLLGDFPVRMSQSEHAGACAWASRQFY